MERIIIGKTGYARPTDGRSWEVIAFTDKGEARLAAICYDRDMAAEHLARMDGVLS